MFVEIEIKHKRPKSCSDAAKYETQIVSPTASGSIATQHLGHDRHILVNKHNNA